MRRKTLAEIVKEAMARKGFNQSTLAEASGVSLDVVHGICTRERGTGIRNALALSRVLDIDPALFDKPRTRRASGGPRRPRVASPVTSSDERRVA